MSKNISYTISVSVPSPLNERGCLIVQRLPSHTQLSLLCSASEKLVNRVAIAWKNNCNHHHHENQRKTLILMNFKYSEKLDFWVFLNFWKCIFMFFVFWGYILMFWVFLWDSVSSSVYMNIFKNIFVDLFRTFWIFSNLENMFLS